MLGIFGLGLNLDSACKLKDSLEKYEEVYLENYTVSLAYDVSELEEVLGKKIKLADREFVESEKIVDLAKRKDVCLLVYGSPLFATTHISLINKARKEKVKLDLVYNSSVFDALGEILSLYKFGKIASLPAWKKNYTPDSFMELVKDNLKIKAHSLILIEPGLSLRDALNILEKSSEKYKVKLDKILVCSRLGLKDKKIIYDKIENLRNKEVKEPYCFVVSSELNFVEEENLKYIPE